MKKVVFIFFIVVSIFANNKFERIEKIDEIQQDMITKVWDNNFNKKHGKFYTIKENANLAYLYNLKYDFSVRLGRKADRWVVKTFYLGMPSVNRWYDPYREDKQKVLKLPEFRK